MKCVKCGDELINMPKCVEEAGVDGECVSCSGQRERPDKAAIESAHDPSHHYYVSI